MTWKWRLPVVGSLAALLLLTPLTISAISPSRQESASLSVPAVQAAGSITGSMTSSSAAPSASATPGVSALDVQIQGWITALSKEQGFEAWKTATWDMFPLGPGTHSWVVLLREGETELGYLVVGSTEDGTYKLVEYGTGENPLFSMQTLYDALVQRGLIDSSLSYWPWTQQPQDRLTRWYAAPLQAFWQLEDGASSRYFDAKTGEELPELTVWLKELQASGSTGTGSPSPTPAAGGSSVPPMQANVIDSISASGSWTPHDPFLKTTWLKGRPLPSLPFKELKKELERPRANVTYTGKWFGGLALYPLAVSGYHQWTSGQSYIALDHSGARYTAYDDTLQLGAYYP